MKIRKATKKDFKEMAKILKEESSKKPYNQKWDSLKSIKAIKDLAKDELFIAEVEGKIVGFIASQITVDDKKKVYLGELWLIPEYQRQGIGNALTTHVEKLYKKKGVKIIRLVTNKKSDSFKFYKKLNYKPHNELIFMEKKLK